MYIVAHCLVFFLPGFLVCAVLGVQRQVLTLSFALSYCWITALTLIALETELSFTRFAGIWLAVLVALTVFAWVAEARWQRRLGDSWVASVFAVPVSWFSGAALIVLGVVAWLLVAGPYIQTPSDVLGHLAYVQGAIADLRIDGEFTAGYGIGVVENPPTLSWYYIIASLVRLSGQSFDSMLLQASIANTTTLLVIVFGFGATVFSRIPGPRATILLAFLTTVLFAIHSGVNVFAYVRYYVFAPGFLLLALYFSTIACVLRFADSRGLPFFWCVLTATFTLVATRVHMQEAIFTAVIFALLMVYLSVEKRFKVLGATDAKPVTIESAGSRLHGTTTALRVHWFVLASVVIIGFAALFFWSHLSLTKNIVFDERVLSIQKYLPTTRDAYFLNPAWQFYRVIGAWGVVVYIGFVVSWSRMREHPFIVVGMLSPIATVFNPFFVDLFLRQSYAQNLWRFSLLVPVAFAGALLAVHAFRDLKGSGSLKKLASCAFLATSALTLSVDQIGSIPTWVRWQTLTQIPADQSPQHFGDLISQLNKLEERTRVITDPVTGYVITAVTPTFNLRKKFFRPKIRELEVAYFSTQRRPSLTGRLLVINRRDASASETGSNSGHWPAEMTLTSAYYSDEFLNFVRTRSDDFELLWQQDRIELYRIK